MIDINLIKQFEGLKLTAYQDSIGIYTIGYGTIRYENGLSVKKGDVITLDRANTLLQYYVDHTILPSMNNFITADLNDDQQSAIASFVYNLGAHSLESSTLLKKLNVNPNDPSIELEFLKWNKAGGNVIVGLTKRRQAEANVYFSR